MKIAEVKNGNVQYAENQIAHFGSSLSVSGGPKRKKTGEPDFMEFLSEKDRRRWDRLSDSKKERILKKAERSAVVRENDWQTDTADDYAQREAVPAVGFSHRDRPERRKEALYRNSRGYGSTVSDTPICTRSLQNASRYESMHEEANLIGTMPEVSKRRKTWTRQDTYTEGSGRRAVNRFSGRQQSSAHPPSTGERNGLQRKSSGGNISGSVGPPSSAGSRIKSRAASGVQINTPSAGMGGIGGFAASAAKKTASRVSNALREKAELVSVGDAAKNLEDFEKASDEVKKVTSPIKKIVGAILALLSMILGPIIFAVIMVIILVVVIIFIVAWLISVLIPAMAAAPGAAGGFASGLMPYYCQQDERWGGYPFNGHTISSDGCGMTSMAMIMACLTGDMNIIPPTIVDTGYNTVLSHGAPAGIASLYGITDIEQMGGPSRNCCGNRGYDLSYLQEKIAEGCPVLVSVSGSYLGVTTSGHYIVLYGQGENGVYVYDPATLGRIYQESISGGGSDWNDTLHDAKHIWIFPAPEIKVEGDTNAEKIFKYLVRAGWSEASAAAAVGNFYQEAGGGGTADINPASYDSGTWGEAGGIAGFTDNADAGNFTALKNYASQRGKDWTDLQIQCEFLVYQLSHGKWWGAYDTPTYSQMCAQGYSVQHMSYEEFTQLTDVDEAVKAFLCFYEDCGYRMAHYEDVRLPMALQAYAAWGSG